MESESGSQELPPECKLLLAVQEEDTGGGAGAKHPGKLETQQQDLLAQQQARALVVLITLTCLDTSLSFVWTHHSPLLYSLFKMRTQLSCRPFTHVTSNVSTFGQLVYVYTCVFVYLCTCVLLYMCTCVYE